MATSKMSSSSTFSNFFPRYKTSREASSPSSGAFTSHLQDPQDEAEPRTSRDRRLSFSRRPVSPTPASPASPGSSAFDARLSAAAASAAAAVASSPGLATPSVASTSGKGPVPPPRLTLTDVELADSNIVMPSPIDAPTPTARSILGTAPSGQAGEGGAGRPVAVTRRWSQGNGIGMPQGWEDNDEIRTPTREDGGTGAGGGRGSSGVLGLGLGEGALTLDAVPDSVVADDGSAGPGGGYSSNGRGDFGCRRDTVSSQGTCDSRRSTGSSDRPTSVTESSFANAPSWVPRPSPTLRTSRSSTLASSSTAGSQGNSFVRAATEAPSSARGSMDDDAASKRRRRGSSAASKKKATAPSAGNFKPSHGIAGALAGMSRDLVSPAQGLVRAPSPALSVNSDRSRRPRANTGRSSLTGSISSKASSLARRTKRRVGDSRPTSEFRTSVDDDMRPAFSDDDERSGGRSFDRRREDDDMGSGSEDEGGYLDSDDLENDEDDDGSYGDLLDDLPVTGFAVASVKRNADFHALFGKAVPEGDYLIEDYGCALQKDILVQGRFYVSENHICFHANIFGWITNNVIAFSEILRIDKKMTAFVIPNAIMITTLHAKYTFASFLSRDTTFDVIHNIWRLSHPYLPSASSDAFIGGSSATPSEADDGVTQADSVDFEGLDSGVPHSPASKHRRGAGAGAAGGASGRKKAAALLHKPTTCACGREGRHLTETALDAIFPSTPEKIYNLMFASGFVKDFMNNNQKLIDIQMSDWAPASSGSNLLTRKMSYIKPLNGSIGPKSTKCELSDVTVHVDFDDYVSMVTTTRTPDVPSGGVFSVQTRTCLMWAGANSTRVLVTCQTDWTGRSFIRSIIDSSALAGQKNFHAAQEIAMRAYIADHTTEFQTEGIEDDDAADDPSGAGDPTACPSPKSPVHTKTIPEPSGPTSGGTPAEVAHQRKVELEGTFLQVGLDSLGSGALQIIKGFWAILEAAWTGLGAQGLLALVIALLVVSNIWTLISLKGSQSQTRTPTRRLHQIGRGPATSPSSPAPLEESPDSVAAAVRNFLEEYIAHQGAVSGNAIGASTAGDNYHPADEFIAISSAIDALETRLARLKEDLPLIAAVLAGGGSEDDEGSLEDLD